MKFKKNQSSVEFIIILSILLLIFFSFFRAFSIKKAEFEDKPVEFAAKIQAERAALAINDIYLAGDNATKKLYFPSTLKEDVNYSLQIHPMSRQVIINYKDSHYSFPILTDNITTAYLDPGLNQFKNIGGFIDVS
ncbi:MAG: hypothetical protein ACQESF_00995 [Nanobdellota archaeon]